MIWLLAAATLLASVPAGLRWLRVAQREHYLPGSVNRFQWKWWRASPANNVIDVFAVTGLIGSLFHGVWGFLVPLAQVGPIGLPLRGVTSPVAWTGRLRRLAALTGVMVASGVGAGALLELPVAIVGPLFGMPFLIDVALFALAPLERRLGAEWVDKAAAKLAAIGPEVVAITGSYGKTTTKAYVAHLLSGSRHVVASPASFNNRMGLARAINENLTPGTEVFIAEMGAYGPGEIADLTSWIPPRVAAIVALGPVHLERFGSLDRILAAKAEILDRAEIGVVCVDHPLLEGLAASRGGDMQMVEVSSTEGIVIAGEEIMEVPDGVFGANLAVALGICRALGVDLAEVLGRVPALPTAEHRQSVLTGGGGFTIIDDTFNSNPVGARAAVATLVGTTTGRTVVVTPGMVELGSLQDEENRRFAEEASGMVDHLVIVGRTNRKALLEGSAKGTASVTVVADRGEAVEWVRSNLGPGDAVLYENDLPDHYP